MKKNTKIIYGIGVSSIIGYLIWKGNKNKFTNADGLNVDTPPPTLGTAVTTIDTPNTQTQLIVDSTLGTFNGGGGGGGATATATTNCGKNLFIYNSGTRRQDYNYLDCNTNQSVSGSLDSGEQTPCFMATIGTNIIAPPPNIILDCGTNPNPNTNTGTGTNTEIITNIPNSNPIIIVPPTSTLIVPNSIAMQSAMGRPFGDIGSGFGTAGSGGVTEKTILDWIPYILGGMTLGLAYLSEKN